MGGYANGGDTDANATSTDTQSRLGGDEGPYILTAAEISVIIVTITIFIIALIMIFYYRKLQARRNIDIMNQAHALSHDTRPLTTPGGESIELKDGSPSIGAAAAASVPLTPTRIDRTSRHLQRTSMAASSMGTKPPLWKYIHWKNPNKGTLPRVEPRRDIQGDIAIPPNPYYG